MKKWALLMTLLLGLSWMMSLAEGFVCESSSHETAAGLRDPSTPDTDTDACHAEACHFGHCMHIHNRIASTGSLEPESRPGSHATPYAFVPLRTPLFFLMRPPLARV